MVYSARNEQHMDFRVHNTSWEPIEFDGLKLMLRPSASRLREKGSVHTGFSSASKRRSAQRARSSKRGYKMPEIYVVVDIETTGLDPEADEIVEIGALKVVDGVVQESMSQIVRCQKGVPHSITRLTGISQEEVDEGCDLESAMEGFLRFIRLNPLVMHNATFDMGFIDAALEQLEIESLENQCIDTYAIARSLDLGLKRFRLDDMCQFFGVEHGDLHRALPDCFATNDVFQKLVELVG